MRIGVNSKQATGKSRQGGFTLLEVLLASFIFMSVVTIAIGSFSGQIGLQSSSDAQRLVQQSSQAIVETISRDFRSTRDFDISGSATCSVIPGPSVSCGDTLEFAPPPSSPGKIYELQPRSGPNRAIRVCDPGDYPGCGQNRLTNPAIIEVVDFRFEGVEPNPDPRLQTVQPLVVIYLHLRTVPTGRTVEQAELITRTMVTSRLFEKYPQTPPN